jgi:hypothetical protein
MMNAAFSDVNPCGSDKNRYFGGTCHLLHQCGKNQHAGNNVSSKYQLSTLRRNTEPPQYTSVATCCQRCSRSLILYTLKMEAIRFSEHSVLTRGTLASHPRRRHSSTGFLLQNSLNIFNVGIMPPSEMLAV